MLRDEVIKYYNPANNRNYSCAESMMRAVNDYYQLNLPEEMFYAVGPFSGGAWHDEMCGGISSSLNVLGILYSVNGHAHDSEVMRRMTIEFLNRVEEKYGGLHCKHLKRNYYVQGIKCQNVLIGCADILEEMISRNEIINKR